MMKCLITGGSGFVGRALSAHVLERGLDLRISFRRPTLIDRMMDAEIVSVGSLSSKTDWSSALLGLDYIVHLAARVHVINDKCVDPLAEFRRINVDGTANLARQAAAAGVRRFVFLSSIKVNGELTKDGHPFTTDDVPAPQDSYGISKHEAEQVLRQIAIETGMEVVIIRSPLVYGEHVKGNFESMIRWLGCGMPLPLAAVTQNRRSFVALENLIDLIMICLRHPKAANHTFFVSDGEDLSTADLLKRLGDALGQPARLYYVPLSLLNLGASLVNKVGIYQRLCGSLQLDISKTREILDWVPPLSVDEGLQRVAKGFFV